MPFAKPVPARCRRLPTARGRLAVAAAIVASASPGVHAQTAANDATQTVIVTGTRASLERSNLLKKNAAVVQDSITATELGRFPDDNVADSLSHITGVSIRRTAGGEGMRVSVRGLGPEFTLTTFNNRILGTDGAGRDFAFDVLPSDVINGADVVKSTQASLTEGAIGGLVNLRTASPFDQRGRHGLLRVEADRNLLTRMNGAKLSGTYSETFGDTVGVLLGVVYADRKVRTDHAGNDGGWARNPDPNDPSWQWGNTWGGAYDLDGNGTLDANEYGLIGPGQFRVGSIMEQKKRLAVSGAVEWRPSSDVKVVADAVYTRLDSPQIGYQQSFYTSYVPGRWTDMKLADNVIRDFKLTDLQPELLNKSVHRVVDTALFGLNGKWKASSALSFEADAYQSTSRRHAGGQDTYVVLRMSQPNTTHVWLTGAQVPNVVTTLADGRDYAKALADGSIGPKDFKTHYFSLGGENIDDKITGLTLNGKWAVDKGWLEQVQFGLQATARRKSRDLVNNAFTGGDGYYSNENAINVGALGGNVLAHTYKLPGFMSNVSSEFPRTLMGFDVPTYIDRLKAYDGQLRPDGSKYDFAQAAAQWNPIESYRVSERTTSAFVQADFGGESWNADVGVRFVRTATSARAWGAQITGITKINDWDYRVQYADPTEVGQDASYTMPLPAANFVWRFLPQWQLRAGLAKTMARPSVDKLAPTSTTHSVTWGEFTQVWFGNANLKPYKATQGDLSLEWYPSSKSMVALAVFRKNIKDQITTEWLTGQDIGAPKPYVFNVMRPINGDHAKAEGIELGFQHLWDNGFGVRGQITKIESRSWVGGEERPLEGIAPATASLGVLYEKGPWSLSMTADHTDGFVSAVNVLGKGYDERVKPITWLTAQASYAFNDRVRLTVEGRNLLDAQEEYMLGNSPLTTQGYNRYGRAVTVGLGVRF